VLKRLSILICISLPTSYCDVLIPIVSPETFSAVTSFEKIFVYEHQTGNHFAVLPWAGCGILWVVYQHDMGSPAIPVGGIEAALEGRIYLSDAAAKGLFVGLYAGGTLMFPTYLVYGTSVGIKSGYKFIAKSRDRSRFAIEPYTSISTSPYSVWEYHGSKFSTIFYGVILTAGVRFTHEWGLAGLAKK
jgi:hypothetical protein